MLLLSTDPAHSLGHAFDLPPGVVGDEPCAVPRAPANLLVRELDAVAALNARRAELERAFDEVAASFGAGAVGQRGAELLELVPPGIDELFGMLSIVAASQHYQLMVVDMAPTGHALRLLEQPDAARQWLRAILRVLLKYRALARPTRLVQELLELSTSISQLQNLLHDQTRTRAVVVTRAAEVPRLETVRLLSQLRRLKVFTPVVVVNAMTLGAGRCVRCRETEGIERVELAALRRSIRATARGSAIIETALAAPPPRGVAALEQWASRWIAGA
jgi:arsenite/tail-anchored protein-transporting ATPase